jgi:hypothetical protein
MMLHQSSKMQAECRCFGEQEGGARYRFRINNTIIGK